MSMIQVGQVVISLTGRDKGKLYVVIDVQDNMASLANGRNRTLEHLKQKKLKQLQKTNTVSKEIASNMTQQQKKLKH